MNFPDTQRIVQAFDDDGAVWRAFDARRRLRDLFGSEYRLDGKIADALDWMWAERHARPVRAIGIIVP